MKNARKITNDFRSDPVRKKPDFKKRKKERSSYGDTFIKRFTIKDLKIVSSKLL